MSHPEQARIERLVALAERLIAALEADIAALAAGKPQDMKSTDPEIQKLTALYSREAAGFNPAAAKAVPKEIMARLLDSTGRIRASLARHARLLTRVRNASEGMIRAIADEVERRRAPMRPYAPPLRAQPQRPSGAMIFNSVV